MYTDIALTKDVLTVCEVIGSSGMMRIPLSVCHLPSREEYEYVTYTVPVMRNFPLGMTQNITTQHVVS